MTEEQIEVMAEQKQDALDRRYLAGEMTEAEYRAKCAEINDWAECLYALMRG